MEHRRVTVVCVGDHHAVGSRDLTGFPSRVFRFLNESARTTRWAVVPGGINGTLRDVMNEVPSVIAETLSYDDEERWAVIWAGIGEIKSGGFPPDAWASMYEQIVHMFQCARFSIIVVVPQQPPSSVVSDKNAKRWMRRARAIVLEIASKYGLQMISLKLEEDEWTDAFNLRTRAYQKVASAVGKRINRNCGPAMPEVIVRPKKRQGFTNKPKSVEWVDPKVVALSDVRPKRKIEAGVTITAPDKIKKRRG